MSHALMYMVREADEIAVRKSIDNLVEQLCVHFDVKAGFVNVKYFSTVFKKHFGVSPSKYL